MENNTVREIIRALKRLIRELEKGYCENLTSEQLERLEEGFNNILIVEKEVKNNRYGLCTDRNNGGSFSWNRLLHALLSLKKKGNNSKV